MKRRWFAVLGSALLLGYLVLTAVFGFDLWRDPIMVTQGVLVLLAGAAFFLAGFGRSAAGLSWLQLIGAGDLLLGILLVSTSLPTLLDDGAESADLVGAAAAVLGGLFLVALGVAYLRGVYDTDAFEPGPLFG
ncbi:hypothetical protein JCM17823_01160 [Halorubrum gandharaense]